MRSKKTQAGIAGGHMSDNKKIGKFMVAAGAIIEHPTEAKILITKRQNTDQENHQWELIYGRVDNFEGLFAGLKREVFEETGIDKIKIIKAIRVWNFFRGEREVKNEIHGITFICKALTDKVQLNHEHSDYEWIDPVKALEKISVPGIKIDLELYLKHREQNDLGINFSGNQDETPIYL